MSPIIVVVLGIQPSVFTNDPGDDHGSLLDILRLMLNPHALIRHMVPRHRQQSKIHILCEWRHSFSTSAVAMTSGLYPIGRHVTI